MSEKSDPLRPAPIDGFSSQDVHHRAAAMDARRFARVKNIVVAARNFEPPLRDALLDRVCGDDQALRSEVRSLLAYDRDAPPESMAGVLAAPPAGAPVPAGRAPALEGALPNQIGPYRILGLLGEGGMGIVYRAEQAEPIRRDVALKLIRSGVDNARIAARFDAERQALALMDHPSIARVLDSGSDELGRPYLVMELVEGTPITEYCDRERLTIGRRLDLFLLVCDAILHAHQRGVIHRDLKPSNVLVRESDGHPIPSVIDFGVAKAVGGERLAAGSLATQEGVLVGTPEYMSPEQAGAISGVVDTRTDVYSLGVLLYELLTGRRPHTLAGRDPLEIPRMILEEDPGRPSMVVTREERAVATPNGPRLTQTTPTSVAECRGITPKTLARSLRGDLDAIVLMALRKEPERRYPSVAHLAEDVRRHLESLPVIARRESWRDRKSGLVRLRRFWVGAVVVLFLALAGLSATLAIRSARVARERDLALAAELRARTEAETAAKVSEFLVGLFEEANADDARGEAVTAREILDRGAERVRAELGDEPLVKGRLLDTFGQVYHGLGLYAEARALHADALELRRRVLGPQHLDVARSLDHLGTVTLATGDYVESERFYLEALRIRRASLGDSSSEVAESMLHLAATLTARGDPSGAEPLYRSALALRRRILGPGRVETARAMSALASCLRQRGRYAEAESLYREAIALERRVLGDRHPGVAATLDSLAEVRWLRGAYAEADTLWREALGIYRALDREEEAAVARAESNLARALRSEGKLEEAERYARSALVASRELVGVRHPQYAADLYGLGVVLSDEGRTEEAAPLLWRALELRRELLGTEHAATASALEAMGDLRFRQGQARVARRYFEEARAVRGLGQPADHADQANPLLGLARVRLRLGDAAGADSCAAAAYAILRVALGDGHPLVREAGALRRETQSRLTPRP